MRREQARKAAEVERERAEKRAEKAGGGNTPPRRRKRAKDT